MGITIRRIYVGARRIHARRRKPRGAFTLVETLICLVLMSIMFGWLPHAAHICQLALSAVLDEYAASNRAEQTFAIIRPVAEMCGYGVPKKPDDFRAAFEPGMFAPFNWPGPVSVADGAAGTSGRAASTCRAVYAISSGARTTAETRTTEGAFSVYVNAAPNNIKPPHSGPQSTKNWALFGASAPRLHPAWLTYTPSESGNGIILAMRRHIGGDELIIPRNDALFYLRAAEMQTRASRFGQNDDFAFCTNDWTGSGWQPRVMGVVDARFELDCDRRLLRVSLLVRGEKRYGRAVTKGTPPGWPDDWAGDIPEIARRYRLYAHSAAFDLKNF